MKNAFHMPLNYLYRSTLLLVGCSSSSTYGKYMTLGEYKGLEISKIKTEITDDDLEQEISYTLDDNTEYFETDRAAQNGDMVNITYSSTMNGEEFDGGSGEDMDIELGAGYLEGDILQDAESEIIGMKADDTKEMDLTIPENYYFDDSLAGQKIHVTLTVNSVSEIKRPELTDEFVASISDFDTVDAYKEDLKKSLEASADENNEYTAGSDALTQVVETVPSKAIRTIFTINVRISMIRPIRLMQRCSVWMFLILKAPRRKQKLLWRAWSMRTWSLPVLLKRKKLTVSDDEYQKYVEDNLDTYGMSSVEEFESTYSKTVSWKSCSVKVQKLLLDNAKITEVSEEDYYQEYEGGEESSTEDVIDVTMDETEDVSTEAASEA